MASECLVIASNLGGNLNVIRHQDNGFLIDPKATYSRCTAIGYLYSNSETRSRFGREARLEMQKLYSLTVMRIKYQTLFQGE